MNQTLITLIGTKENLGTTEARMIVQFYFIIILILIDIFQENGGPATVPGLVTTLAKSVVSKNFYKQLDYELSISELC